jgi:hypothetical protein
MPAVLAGLMLHAFLPNGMTQGMGLRAVCNKPVVVWPVTATPVDGVTCRALLMSVWLKSIRKLQPSHNSVVMNPHMNE